MNESTQRRINVSAGTIELLAPAKINLFLYVTGRRPDGYHELCSLMCCVSLYDRIVIRMGVPGNEIICDHPDAPGNENNLAFKAAILFNDVLFNEARITPDKLSIHLDKQIPVGAGLGGGSSDAAAVLNGLNAYYDQPLDRRQLHAMALTLGADVPFFIDQIPALAQGVGERLTPYEGLPSLWAVLIYPGFGISTAQVFKNFKLRLTKSEKELRYFPFKNRKFDASRHLYNDLEQGVGNHSQVIEKSKKDLLALGALGALMTGSGSVVFGLFTDEAGAQSAKHVLEQQAGRTIWVAQLIT